MIVSNLGNIPILKQATAPENGTNIAKVSGKSLPVEENHSNSVEISQAARTKILEEINSGGLIDFTGEQGQYKKGLMMALGTSTVQRWSAKGLTLSDESVIAAANAFQDAFNNAVEESGSSLAGSGIALNKHQIIINSQQVPGWFSQEYDSVLASMDDTSMKSAFENGELFAISNATSSTVNALASYASVAKNI